MNTLLSLREDSASTATINQNSVKAWADQFKNKGGFAYIQRRVQNFDMRSLKSSDLNDDEDNTLKEMAFWLTLLKESISSNVDGWDRLYDKVYEILLTIQAKDYENIVAEDQLIVENALPIFTKAMRYEEIILDRFLRDERTPRLIMDGLFSRSAIIRKAYSNELIDLTATNRLSREAEDRIKLIDYLFNNVLSKVYLESDNYDSWNYFISEKAGNSHEFFRLCGDLVEKKKALKEPAA